ncbi:unnamed protein product [Caenorhabditis bovis]|uniref:Peptidase C1A papain C-terminal domain-containing protein n=1 Tax=Caenorhabditis bovis TaxID=2654633 RepID=A0A8S1FC96_9PELO|nr:unnamed protein product [Caenorhabditis bovis]
MFRQLLLLALLWQLRGACSSWDGRECRRLMSAQLLSRSTLEYKCDFPIFLVDSKILKKDPMTVLTMKMREYCPRSCCLTTTTTTTTTTTEKPKSPAEKFDDILNADQNFKSLLLNLGVEIDPDNGLKRYEKYANVKDQVDIHNEMFATGKSSFKMKANKFSVSLPDEIAPLTLDVSALTPIQTDSIPRTKRASGDSSVDWRRLMKPVTNQYDCGGCWAFSMVAMIEAFFAIRNYTIPSLSIQQLLTCDTDIEPTWGVANIGCRGGYFQVAAWYLKNRAERSADDIPFDLEDTSCDADTFAPVTPKILTFDTGFISKPNDIEELERRMEDRVRRGPISVGMAVSDDIYSYAEGIYDGECGSTINHAVVIVGFTMDYWIIRNSWGEDWGENGYMRLKRTPGKDNCKLYQYWAQALEVGEQEKFVQKAVNPIVNHHVSTMVPNKNQCGIAICNVCAGDCDDDDDEDDELDDEIDDESSITIKSTTSSSTTSTTKNAMPVPSGYHAVGQQQQPSCFTKIRMGLMMGAMIGGATGVLLGGFMGFRMGLRGKELLIQTGKTVAQSGGSFGVFMGVAQGLRC